MSSITPSQVYAKVAEAVVADPSLAAALVSDLGGTLNARFHIKLNAPASLVPMGDGFRLTYDGRAYDLRDPRTAVKGELDDAELEFVSGGGDECLPAKANPFSDIKTHL